MFPYVEIGVIHFSVYGLFIWLAFAGGLVLASRLARWQGLEPGVFWDAALLVLILAIVGARLLNAALDWPAYRGNPLRILMVWEGGLSLHGGLIGGLAAGMIHARRAGVSFLRYMDVGAAGLALGMAIGRVGCLMQGCCYGVPTTLPWGVAFVAGSDVHYHPVQAYAALLDLVIVGLLIWRLARPFHVGQVLASFVMLFALSRFGEEFLRRGISAEVALLGLTQAQLASIPILLLGLAAYVWLGRRTSIVPPAAGKLAATSD